jgi:hypothetical protein
MNTRTHPSIIKIKVANLDFLIELIISLKPINSYLTGLFLFCKTSYFLAGAGLVPNHLRAGEAADVAIHGEGF